MDLIIRNGFVLGADGTFERKDIGIVGNRIDTIEDEDCVDSISAKHEVNAHGGFIIPGLVNTHTHLGMTLLRGYADDLPLFEWLSEHIWPIEAKITPEHMYAGCMLGCLEMIKSGTTAFADMYIHVDKVAQAVADSGMRANLAYGMIDLGDKERADSELAEGKRFVDKYQGAANGRIKAMYGPHAPNTCSREFLVRVKEQAQKDNAMIHIHILETEAELNEMKEKFGMCSVNMLEDAGFLGSDGNNIIAAHCIWLSDGDIKILQKHGVNISHNPTSNMKLASGIAPVAKMLDFGCNVALGTDGCASNNNLDMFGEMKLAALLHKMDTNDASVLPAPTVLDMATRNGAKALGIDAGILAPGKLADIIIIDANKPQMVPHHNIVSNLVYSANGNDVMTTIVDGQVLMEDYKVLTMDEDAVIEQAQIAAKEMADAVK
ncbi:MAG: amidohydrolase family protein [Methanosarcinales archaeon]|nr:amidohydrolase family protein [Methanosarcinales archaeon]